MDLLTETLLITLVAAIGFAHDGSGSFMYNRPIIMGPLVGLVLGDLRLGIMTGATLELVWLGAFPVGASCPPEMVSGSIIGTSFVIKTGGDPGAAIALAVLVATLVLMIKSGLRVVITSPVFCAHADKCAAAGDAKGVENTERIGWAFEIISLSLIVGISYYLGVPQIEAIIKAIPEFVNHGLNVATGIIPAIGFAMLFKMIANKEVVAFFFGGFLLAAYLKVPVFGVALMACVIVALILTIKQNNKTCVVEEGMDDDNEF